MQPVDQNLIAERERLRAVSVVLGSLKSWLGILRGNHSMAHIVIAHFSSSGN